MADRRCGPYLALLVVSLGGAPAAGQLPDSLEVTRLGDSLFVLDGAVDRIGVLVGDDGVLMVDVGYPETEALVREALDRIGAGAPDVVVNTHWHHAFANAAFAGDAEIVAHRNVGPRLPLTKFMFDRDVPPFPPEAVPGRTFEDSLTLRFGGERVRLLHYPAAHTDGDVVVHFVDSGVIMTGDLVVPHVPWIDLAAGGDAYGWLAAVDDMLEWVPEDAVLAPGHDRLADPDDLRGFRDLLAEAIGRVEDGRARGATRDEIAAAGLSDRWSAWEGPIATRRFLEDVHTSVLRREARTARAEDRCRYTGGRWWNGEAFEERAVEVVGGRFVAPGDGPVPCEIDLGGLWVVPPYADAHRHDLADPATLDRQLETYVERGVFYAMEQDPLRIVGPDVRDRVAGPAGVDVAYTQGVISPSWGSITAFYRTMAEDGVFGGRTLEEVDGREIFIVDDRADLERHWPAIAGQNDAFVKLIVAFSEEFERRSSDAFVADPPGGSAVAGLDPALVPEIVRRAHEAGLRASVHVETAADFRLAVDAGADMIAHLPGSWQVGPATGYPEGEMEPWLLTPDDARAAAETGTVVVTTVARGRAEPDGGVSDEIQRRNLRALEDAGATVAFGADGFEPVVLGPGEALYLHRLGAYDAPEALDVLTRATPRAIFPDRRIGRLEPGFEASFLVLDADPTAELVDLRRIALRVKRGRVLAR